MSQSQQVTLQSPTSENSGRQTTQQTQIVEGWEKSNGGSSTHVDGNQNIFFCKTHSVKTLCTLLPCMRGDGKDQVIQLTITEDSLLFVVEDNGKCMQANSLLQGADNFDKFEVTLGESNESQKFNVALNLRVFIDSLLIFGPAKIRDTSVSMAFNSIAPDCFQLVLEENGVVTECSLTTQVCWDMGVNYNQEFLRTPVESEVIMKSANLKDVFVELADTADVTHVDLSFGPTAPFFCLTAKGSWMSCEIDFNDKSEAFLSFCSKRPQRQAYELKFLKMAFRALTVATTTYIRINAEGLLCVQHTLEQLDLQNECVVSFVVYPRDGDEEYEDNDEGENEEQDH